jgi:hypothetical protein
MRTTFRVFTEGVTSKETIGAVRALMSQHSSSLLLGRNVLWIKKVKEAGTTRVRIAVQDKAAVDVPYSEVESYIHHPGLLPFSENRIKIIPLPDNAALPESFSLVELFSFVLPPKARREIFEPAYNDMKGDFLKALRRFNGRGQRRWLMFWFVVHTSFMIVNCFWVMCGTKVKRVLLALLPEGFRRPFGG